MSAAVVAAANKIFANKWHSSDPGGSEALTIRMVITYVIVSIRIYCKIAKGSPKPMLKRFGLDDVFILLALIPSTLGEGIVLWGVTRGGSGMQSPILVKAGRYAGVQDFLIVSPDHPHLIVAIKSNHHLVGKLHWRVDGLLHIDIDSSLDPVILPEHLWHPRQIPRCDFVAGGHHHRLDSSMHPRTHLQLHTR